MAYCIEAEMIGLTDGLFALKTIKKRKDFCCFFFAEGKQKRIMHVGAFEDYWNHKIRTLPSKKDTKVNHAVLLELYHWRKKKYVNELSVQLDLKQSIFAGYLSNKTKLKRWNGLHEKRRWGSFCNKTIGAFLWDKIKKCSILAS